MKPTVSNARRLGLFLIIPFGLITISAFCFYVSVGAKQYRDSQVYLQKLGEGESLNPEVSNQYQQLFRNITTSKFNSVKDMRGALRSFDLKDNDVREVIFSYYLRSRPAKMSLGDAAMSYGAEYPEMLPDKLQRFYSPTTLEEMMNHIFKTWAEIKY